MSGDSSVNQRSFVSGDMGCTGTPEMSYSSVLRSAAACSLARPSAHVMSEVSGRFCESSPMSPCIAALTDTPATSGPCTSARASSVAATMTSGSCTCHPACGLCNEYSRIAARVTPWNATALTAVVPTSSPMIVMAAGTPVWGCL